MLIEPEPVDWSFIQEIIRPSTTSPAYGPAIISLPRILQKESEILMKIDPDSNPTHYITGDFVGGMREKPSQNWEGFGNENISNYHPLGGQVIQQQNRNLYANEACCYFDNQKLFISQSLKQSLEQPFAPPLIQNLSTIYVGSSQQDQGLTANVSSIIEDNNMPKYLIHKSSHRNVVGGFYPIIQVTGKGSHFSLKNTKDAVFTASASNFCYCNLLGFNSAAEKASFDAEHSIRSQHRLISAYGLRFNVLHYPKAGTDADSVCKTQPYQLWVTKKMDNPWYGCMPDLFIISPRSHTGSKMLRLCKLKQIPPQNIFFKLYAPSEISNLAKDFQLTEIETNTLKSNILNINDIPTASPFDAGVYVIPTWEGLTLAYLLSPALLTELVIRWLINKNLFTVF